MEKKIKINIYVKLFMTESSFDRSSARARGGVLNLKKARFQSSRATKQAQTWQPESEITTEIRLDFAKELWEFRGVLKDFGKKENDFLKELRQEKCEGQQ